MKRTTSPPELLLPLDRTSPRPLRAQLECELRKAIQAGRLAEGALLPSTRALARDLGLSRNTVEAALAQLDAEGFLERRVGAGSYVALPEHARPPAPVRPPARAPA